MKTRIILIAALMFVCLSLAISKESLTAKNPPQAGTLNVFASPDLYELTSKWIGEFRRSNPEVKIELVSTTDADIPILLKNKQGLGFINDKSFSALQNADPWKMTVGRNVLIPIMNHANPFKEELDKKGITSNGFAHLLKTTQQNWEALMETQPGSEGIPVHFYFVNDPVITNGVINFTGIKEPNNKGVQVENEQQLINAIQKDRMGLGFCRLNTLTEELNKGNALSVNIVPIDKNHNGKIDYSEAIYTNLQEFSRGIWIGKYPASLSGKIYSVSSAKPNKDAEISFLNWVLTDGQQFLNPNGYSDLVFNERQSQLNKINEPSAYSEIRTAANPVLMIKFMILLTLIASIVVIDLVFRRSGIKKRRVPETVPVNLLNIVNQSAIVIPKGIYFDKTHTWAFMKKDGSVKLGIDDFLQHVTGPITKVNMKSCGEKIKKGERLVTIFQKGKQLNIYSPVTGTISATNKNLMTDAGLLNSSPFANGWVYIVEPSNWTLEIQFMNMAETYANWLTTEYARLRDFFATAVRVHVPAFVTILQDGGVLRDGILAELSPEVWDDFQTKFIDTSR
jgi:glycine cleavage system H lipoate-binding protein/ABC-type phosphate transport system substrate-binding protein